MLEYRCISVKKLVPPVPSPSPLRDEAGVPVGAKKLKFSAERPIESESRTPQSTLSPNAFIATAHDASEGVTTPSPSNPAGSSGREGSMNWQTRVCRTPSAHVHPAPFSSPGGVDFAESAVVALAVNKAPPHPGSIPAQSLQEKTEAAGAGKNSPLAGEALVDSAPRSPLRRDASHVNEVNDVTGRDLSILSTVATAACGAAQNSNCHLDASRSHNVSIGLDGLPLEVARQAVGTAHITTTTTIPPPPASSSSESLTKFCRSAGSPAQDTLPLMPRTAGGYTSCGALPHKVPSESSSYYDSTLGTAGITLPAGMNSSGCTSSQRALVQYVTSPTDMETLSHGCRDSATGGDAGYGPCRHVEIRAMLIMAERELAEVREECAKRGMKVETLEAALDRERTNLRALRDRHAGEATAVREEHDAQTRQLREQLHVLKMVSESAMAEKSKMAEDAARRKKELLALLDREREEKSYIMADYREQTESLIAEQGREITSLRGALNKLKGEYDAVSKQRQTVEEELEGLQEKLEDMTAQMEKERSDAASKAKDLQANMQQECESLREHLAVMQEQLQRAAIQHTARQKDLSDQLQKDEEKLRVMEEEHQHALDALKQAYRRDTDSLREEMNRVKEAHYKQEEELRHDLEKVTKRESRSVESLRQALEQARQEKDLSVEEGLKQRETLQRQHRDKMAALQKERDETAQQLAEELSARKNREADVEVLRVRAENMEKANQRLSNELETTQAAQRTRERSTEQAHQVTMEAMRTKLRTALTDLGYAQEQLSQQAADAQQLRDELARRTSALEAAKEKILKLESVSADELSKAKDAALQRENEDAQTITQLRTSKTQLEATCEQLERQLKEMEGRVQGTVKQVDEERRALEEANCRLQDARVEVEDLRSVVNHERERGANALEEKRQLERQLAEEKLYHEELENTLHMAERKLQEQQQDHARQLKQMDGKLEEQAQRHHAELAAARMATEQVRGEVVRMREVLAEKETSLQRAREDVGRLHREAAMREGGLQEEMEDLREAQEVEMRRIDELLNGLRSDLAKSQATCAQYQRELSNIHRSSAGARSDLEMALEQADVDRAKLLEDLKYRDQLNQELQGTVRLLSSRLSSNEEEVRRMQEELADTNKRIQDAHTLIGRKDAAIGQLNAKLRAYESRH
ncbi:hypothetical protein JKF63_05307 [Porcisia hertigi]|uniref:Uncharacterized protein n=1 Tax=Porcisia hertigi TaxID=2761500 RepID=A0A836LIS6_9TRYP|nr:hypothetical protein JKF63_05307 [Porcisia hertigi]